MSDFELVVSGYSDYLSDKDPDAWPEWIDGVNPVSRCGGVTFEIPNPLSRASESFAIADLSGVITDGAHFHDETDEAFIVIKGMGVIASGFDVRKLEQGDNIIIPRSRYHILRPIGTFVVAVVMSPPLEYGHTDNSVLGLRQPALPKLVSYMYRYIEDLTPTPSPEEAA